jgi:DNA-binding transcriptional ArsR family regulator
VAAADSIFVEPLTAPRVIDASRPLLRVEVAVSEAAELLMSLSTVLGAQGAETFDLGAGRIGEIRSAIPADLLAAAEEIFAGEAVAAQLLGLVHETPAPRAIDGFIAQLGATEPLEVQLHLLGYHARGHHIAEPETIRRAALGDASAAEELLGAAGQWAEKRRVVEWALARSAEEVRSQLLDVLGRWNVAVLQPTLSEIRPLLERDAEEKRKLAATLAPSEFVERATGGIQYAPRPEIHELVFFPSYWFRPWVMHSEHKTARIFCYPIRVDGATQLQESGARTDLSGLARLYKALADERRLALLGLLSRGPVTLGDASREVGLSKSTTHHHLAILRHAGLVLIREDEERTYALRPERLDEVRRLLERNLTV